MTPAEPPTDDPLGGRDLPPVTVDAEDALDRTRARGHRRLRRRRAVLAATSVVAIVLVGALAVAVTRDGGSEDVVAGDDSSTTTSGTPAPPDGDLAIWAVDPDRPPDPGATSFVALVNRVECNDGVTGEVLAPSVEVRPDSVVVTFAVAPNEPVPHTCPGNDVVPYTVELGEPLGDRPLRDGACTTGDPRAVNSSCVVPDGTDEGRRSDVRWPVGLVLEPRECEAPEGSPLDVAHEPSTRSYGDWSDVTDGAGCLVRIDVLAERSGPDHCGWGAARVLVTGTAFWGPDAPVGGVLQYVRDPDGVFGDPELVGDFGPDLDLPDDAEPSGYFIEGQAVWVVPDDPSSVWVVTRDTTVERWPEGQPPVCN